VREPLHEAHVGGGEELGVGRGEPVCRQPASAVDPISADAPHGGRPLREDAAVRECGAGNAVLGRT
jgi:hypothetical protein